MATVVREIERKYDAARPNDPAVRAPASLAVVRQ
jgi:hypothetical protein